MKDSTIFLLCGLLLQLVTVVGGLTGAHVLFLAAFCLAGIVLIGFGFDSLRDDN